MKLIVQYFDSLEDSIRNWLSHYPILYALLVGTGIILFWRGIWHTADLVAHYTSVIYSGVGMDWTGVIWWDGPISIIIGVTVLLLCGAFVSSFIGNEIIISGLKGEKKISEKIEKELGEIEKYESR